MKLSHHKDFDCYLVANDFIKNNNAISVAFLADSQTAWLPSVYSVGYYWMVTHPGILIPRPTGLAVTLSREIEVSFTLENK